MKRSALAIAVCLAFATASHAQTLEDRLRAQLVSVTAQLRELQAKQLAQPASGVDEARLKARLAAAEAEVRALRRRPSTGASSPASTATTEDLKAQLAALTGAKAKSDADLAAAREAAERANLEKTRLEAEAQRGRSLLAADAQGLEACRAKNIQALQVARYVLKAYQQITVADVLARKEPVSGIARTRIEQIEQTYADQIYDSRLDAQPKAAAAQDASPTPPAKP